jgi:hypothetical protein
MINTTDTVHSNRRVCFMLMAGRGRNIGLRALPSEAHRIGRTEFDMASYDLYIRTRITKNYMSVIIHSTRNYREYVRTPHPAERTPTEDEQTSTSISFLLHRHINSDSSRERPSVRTLTSLGQAWHGLTRLVQLKVASTAKSLRTQRFG